MHSSYALSTDDFAVERDGQAGSLSDLWPGGYQPGDRLGVVLNQPMDPCGCSNLICGTNTLFYEVLRETKGTGGFFRYADTYLIGVGCEPGDFNQLDVWPMHKFVGVLQPTAEAVLETINDRRITLLVLPEVGLRCRGEVVLSTWNALLAQVRCVVTYSPRTGRARDGDIGLLGNKIVESYVEQAIFSTPGIGAGEQARLRRLRRAIDREPLRSYEEFKSMAPEWSGFRNPPLESTAWQSAITLGVVSNIGYDIGGWDGASTDTVYARWFAAGAFNPFMWAHGQEAHEPYAHGAAVEEVARGFLGVRYRLVPFLYSLNDVAHRTGTPILRALAFQQPGEDTATIDDEFFLGDDLLVAPVTDDRGRDVFLPDGTWYDFFDETPPEHGGTVQVRSVLYRWNPPPSWS